MTESCCASNDNIMILACSGASNVGQLSNQAAVELTQEGFGKMFCLAGIGGLISGYVWSAKNAPVLVAVDGCQMGCAKAIMKNGRVPLDRYLVITDEGIEKNKNLNLERADIDCVKAAVKRVVSQSSPVDEALPVGACGCKPCR
jgi:uncharacterized metal-binding protein